MRPAVTSAQTTIWCSCTVTVFNMLQKCLPYSFEMAVFFSLSRLLFFKFIRSQTTSHTLIIIIKQKREEKTSKIQTNKGRCLPSTSANHNKNDTINCRTDTTTTNINTCVNWTWLNDLVLTSIWSTMFGFLLF